MPTADPQGEGIPWIPYQFPDVATIALDLLAKMLTFDPAERVTVLEALEHPWLSSYHDPDDEPLCPEKFDKWKDIEKLETLEQFRKAIWNEIEDYRKEVRGMNIDMADMTNRTIDMAVNASVHTYRRREPLVHETSPSSVGFPQAIVLETSPEEPEERIHVEMQTSLPTATDRPVLAEDVTAKVPVEHTLTADEWLRKRDNEIVEENKAPMPAPRMLTASPEVYRQHITSPTDPLIQYARRPSVISRQGSTYNSPIPSSQNLAYLTGSETISGQGGSSIVVPGQGYVVPVRSRTGSAAGGGEVMRKLLRTLSTVSIHESSEGLAGGLTGVAPIGKYIPGVPETEADAPPSEIPRDFRVVNEDEEEDEEKELMTRPVLGGFSV